MKKANTSVRLKQIMQERGLKQVDILKLAEPYCKKLGIKLCKNDLSQYVSGKVEPGQFKLSALASALKVSEVWLMGYGDEYIDPLSFENITPLRTKRIPLIGDIACGIPLYCNEEYEHFIDVSDDIKADFALTARGDSMINARIFDGDIVFVRECPMVDNGEIAVVIINDEATLKRVYRYSDRIELRAENPVFEPLNYEGEELNSIRILGKAVAFQSMIR